MVAQAEERRLATHGPFPNSFERLLYLKRTLGGYVTLFVHGRKHLSELGRRGLAKRGAAKGGRAILRLYGREHFREIGQRGARVRWGQRAEAGTEGLGCQEAADAGW